MLRVSERICELSKTEKNYVKITKEEKKGGRDKIESGGRKGNIDDSTKCIRKEREHMKEGRRGSFSSAKQSPRGLGECPRDVARRTPRDRKEPGDGARGSVHEWGTDAAA
ncbi:hypothetical protein NDU88_002326 [Pleurodeles waltl]|uniref:Uncharacterized protein n=1 Tax=Pleurodeles waltl TaxID=8319 RepID=A0AAV7VA89_PLEWA|nr:hypothetical protein NDU88_002326 [Pleurodeles waltl]